MIANIRTAAMPRTRESGLYAQMRHLAGRTRRASFSMAESLHRKGNSTSTWDYGGTQQDLSTLKGDRIMSINEGCILHNKPIIDFRQQ